MNLLAGFIAQLLHAVLVAAAAPTLVGLCRWIEARLAGRAGPSVLQPWRDLLRLTRKQSMLAESASDVSSFAPLATLAAIGFAACLVPSFALGMTLSPLADLLVIAGLLAMARCSLALAAMDAGTAFGGMGASRSMALACLSDAAVLMVAFVLALLAGSLNVDLIAAMQQESGFDWRSGIALAFMAIVLVALADGAAAPSPSSELAMLREAMFMELAGPELAAVKAADALRLLVWFDLIGTLFLPFGIAPAGTGPAEWLVGLACWLLRSVLFATVLAVAHAVLGRIRLQHAAGMLGAAAVIGFVAALFLLANMGSV
jgi:formate hydrogenlyase subunit 4